MQIAVPTSLAACPGFGTTNLPMEQVPLPEGDGVTPPPLDLFLASVGTCAALYAFRFCRSRQLETDGMSVSLSTERWRELSRLASIRLEIRLPRAFPERYRDAIARAAQQCRAMRHPFAPPRFEVVARTA